MKSQGIASANVFHSYFRTDGGQTERQTNHATCLTENASLNKRENALPRKYQASVAPAAMKIMMMMEEARRHLQDRVFLVAGATGGPPVPTCGEKAIHGLSFGMKTFLVQFSLFCFVVVFIQCLSGSTSGHMRPQDGF